MSWQSQQGRVSNPFGGGPSTSGFGSFGQSSFGAFGGKPQPSPFSTESRLQSSTFQAPKGGKGKGKGKGSHQESAVSHMQDDSSQVSRASNPFAAIGAAPVQALSYDDAVSQYKTEYVRKKGYPFSCFGLPEESPILAGDISPAELRWYLSQGNADIQKAIGDRSNLLNEDFTDFIKAAGGDAPFVIKRAGPYRIPDPEFPSFVPRTPFSIISSDPGIVPTESELYIYQTRAVPDGSDVPVSTPPLDLR